MRGSQEERKSNNILALILNNLRITLMADASDPILTLKAADILQAMGSGFAPDSAFKLLKEDNYFSLFDIRDYSGKDQKHMRRIRARVIGTNGKTRRIMEDLSGADISIYGHTVAIIGDIYQLDLAKRAVDLLLSGSEHKTVYRYLEREHKKMRFGF